MIRPERFTLCTDGKSITIDAVLTTPDEIAWLIRAIEANRWLLAPATVDGDGLTGSNLAHAVTVPASPPKSPDSAPAASPPPDSDAPGSRPATAAMDALTAAGSQIAGPKKDRKTRTAEVREIIAAMWPTGASLAKISAATGASLTTVRNVSRSLGLPLRETQIRAKAVDRLAEFRARKRIDAARAVLSEESREELGPATAATAHEVADAPDPDVDPVTGETHEGASGGAPSAPELVGAPAAVPETDVSPAAGNGSAIGHASLGKLLVSTDGIALYEHAIEYGVRTIDLTAMECRALAVILRAAAPVGIPFILKRAWAGVRVADAETELANVCRGLRERLPAIGLDLRTIKGVGIQVVAMETVAA